MGSAAQLLVTRSAKKPRCARGLEVDGVAGEPAAAEPQQLRVLVALWLALASARAAFRVRFDLPAAPAPERPVLLYNLRSGAGKAGRFDLPGKARMRGIEPIEREEEKAQGDERTGLQILKHALEEPTRQLAENSGEDGGVVVHEMRTHQGNFGFDAAQRKYLDLVEAGVIDPTKVVRLALENAASAASLLLLSEATLTEVREEKEERTPSMPE